MLSSVLNSERAIHVNIQIMRTFTKLKEIIFTHKELALKLQMLEKKFAHTIKIGCVLIILLEKINFIQRK